MIFMVWNLNLNSDFFDVLKDTICNCSEMKFIACNIGDSIGEMIESKLSLMNLRYINISSDRFSNKGIKKMTKFTNLVHIKSSNTNITSDGLKILNKKIGGYKQICLFYIKNFIEMIYVKLGVRMLKNYTEFNYLILATSVEFSQDQCPYLPWLSKLERV